MISEVSVIIRGKFWPSKATYEGAKRNAVKFFIKAKQVEAQDEQADPEGDHGDEQKDGHLSVCCVFAGGDRGRDERQEVQDLRNARFTINGD